MLSECALHLRSLEVSSSVDLDGDGRRAHQQLTAWSAAAAAAHLHRAPAASAHRERRLAAGAAHASHACAHQAAAAVWQCESWLQALHGGDASSGGLTGGTGATQREGSSELPQSYLHSSQVGSASASASQSHHDHMTSQIMGPLASNASQATSHEHASSAAEPYVVPAAPAAQHAAAHAEAAAPTRSNEAASAAVSLAQTEFGQMSATDYAAFIRQQRGYGAGAAQHGAQPAHAAAGAAGPSGRAGRTSVVGMHRSRQDDVSTDVSTEGRPRKRVHVGQGRGHHDMAVPFPMHEMASEYGPTGGTFTISTGHPSAAGGHWHEALFTATSYPGQLTLNAPLPDSTILPPTRATAPALVPAHVQPQAQPYPPAGPRQQTLGASAAVRSRAQAPGAMAAGAQQYPDARPGQPRCPSEPPGAPRGHFAPPPTQAAQQPQPTEWRAARASGGAPRVAFTGADLQAHAAGEPKWLAAAPVGSQLPFAAPQPHAAGAQQEFAGGLQASTPPAPALDMRSDSQSGSAPTTHPSTAASTATPPDRQVRIVLQSVLPALR